MHFHSNLKFLRRDRGFSQEALAEAAKVSRSNINSYERGTEPNYEVLVRISNIFKISADALIRLNLSKLSAFELSELKRGYNVDLTGEKIRLLTVSVDSTGKENIEAVPLKAQAGYTTGHADPEFISALNRFYIPFLPSNRTYRCFEIRGDSMPPISHGSWVLVSYQENWQDIKDGHRYVIVTKDEGLVLKRVYNKLEDSGAFLLTSDNPDYQPYLLRIEDVFEIWRYERAIIP